MAPRWIWLLVGLHLLLSNLYGLVTPPFEASDELFHYPYVHHLVTERRFPIQDPLRVERWRQEGGQPPLYYLVAAAATFWIDTTDLPERLVYNPHAQIGVPLAPNNKNMVVHSPAEQFPYRGTVLAVHLIRLLSTLMGAGTVLLTYRIAREILPRSEPLALTAAAATAFNPMFLFIAASVNNDNLAALLCSLALWQMVHLVRVGATPARVAGIGLVTGLASLTKISALGLIPLVALVITWDAWKRRSLATWLGHGLLAASLVALVGGGWYLRNWVFYGDPLGFNVWLAIAGARNLPPGPGRLLSEFEGFRISYWGLFGGVNILMHPIVYRFYDLLALLSLAGLLWGGGQWIAHQTRTRHWRHLLEGSDPRLVQMAVLALWVLILVAALVRWTRLTPASQGRLVFPGIAAISFWLALGWHALAPRRWRKAALGMVVAALLVVAAVVPWAFIAPVYATPATTSSLPETLTPTHIGYGDQIELVGYHLPDPEITSGEDLVLQLGWRARVSMAEDYSIFVHLYGPNGEFLGQADTYPGGGLLPTSRWAPGDQLLDTVYVPTHGRLDLPALGRVVVGIYQVSDMTMLPARDSAGTDLGSSPTIGRFKVVPRQAPAIEIPEATDFQFGPKLALIGYDLSAAPGAVTLYWQADGPVTADYTVFVHVVDANGQKVAQMDSQPQDGTYPTSWWSAGEVVPDRHALPQEILAGLAHGAYTLRIGLYNLASGERLPVTQAGAPQGDQIVLGPVTVP